MLTPLQQHKQQWAGGCGSTQCSRAGHVVLCRGHVPCDVLFVGEAPGASEDSMGIPFAGPAGHRMDLIVARALPKGVTAGFCNLVGCLPRDERGKKAGEPDEDQILQCRDRLEQFIEIAQPQLLVCVGRLADDYTEPGMKYSVHLPPGLPRVAVLHPAFILRQNWTLKETLTKRSIVAIRNAVDACGLGREQHA